MTSDESSPPFAFHWNATAWFGAQLGATLWLLILGVLVWRKDMPSAALCFGGFVALHAWGLFLWSQREQLGAHSGLQRYLAVASVIVGAVVVVFHARGVSEPRTPGALVSTDLPYGVIGLLPGLMLLFYVMERSVRSGQKG